MPFVVPKTENNTNIPEGSGPDLHSRSFSPQNRFNCFAFRTLRPALISGTHGLQTDLGESGSCFAEACFGQSLPVIIICQLPLEILERRIWNPIPGLYVAGWNPILQLALHTPVHTSNHSHEVMARLRQPESPALVLVPPSPSWFGQESHVEMCPPTTRMWSPNLQDLRCNFV